MKSVEYRAKKRVGPGLGKGWRAVAILCVLVALPAAATNPGARPKSLAPIPVEDTWAACPGWCTGGGLAPAASSQHAGTAAIRQATDGVVSASTGNGEDGILQSISIQNATLYTGIGVGAWGQGPSQISVDPSRALVFVVDNSSDSVTAYDANLSRQVAVLRVGSDPDGVSFAPSQGETFVSNYASNTVSVINDTTLEIVATVPIQNTTSYDASGPGGMAYDPALGTIFVADRGHSIYNTVNITEIDPSSNSVVANVSTTWNPSDVVYDPVSQQLVVVDQGNGELLGYNATTFAPVENVTCPGYLGATVATVDPSTGDVFVDGVDFAGDQSVQKYNATLTYLGATNFSRYSSFPSQIAVVPPAGVVLLSNGTVVESVSESTLAVGPVVATGACLDAGVYDPSSQDVYMVDGCQDRTILLSGSNESLLGSIVSVGDPTALATDPSSGNLWVDNLGGDAVFSSRDKVG
ncbi:MAG: YncE family protein [Thermoplasmata archaeon]|nr:YncE family protein [Thermoplasmata archaeon]